METLSIYLYKRWCRRFSIGTTKTMAKNFDKMSEKSLNVLLKAKKTTDDERAQIQAILDQRAEAKANPVETPTVVEIEADDAPTAEPSAEELELMEERKQRVNAMREKVGHKCKVVPFNTATWVDGVISSVLDDSRAKNPLWVVKSDEGKTIRKAYGSELIEILDEKVALPTRAYRGGNQPKVEYTPEQIYAMMAEATSKIGYVIEYTDRNSDLPITGIIWGVSHEKRSNRVMMRIKLANGKFAHKVWGTEYTITEDFDEEVVSANADRLAKAQKLANDPNAALNFAKEELEALQKQMENLQARIDAKAQEVKALEVGTEELE